MSPYCGVLEDGIAEVVVEFPTGDGNDFCVAVEGFVGGDEVETRIGRAGGIARWGHRAYIVGFDSEEGAEAVAAVGERNKAGGEV